MPDPTPTFDAPSRLPRRFRRTRIAVSVFFGVLAVALAILWVRSYSWRDELFGIPKWSGTVAIVSINGRLDFHSLPPTSNDIFGDTHFQVDRPLGVIPNLPTTLMPAATNQLIVSTPHWSVVVIFTILAVIPWLSRRFSLRTMLIATTLIAVVLGLGVWLIR